MRRDLSQSSGLLLSAFHLFGVESVSIKFTLFKKLSGASSSYAPNRGRSAPVGGKSGVRRIGLQTPRVGTKSHWLKVK